MDDFALLRAYADAGSEEAFGQLVSRYVATVYSAARRQIGEPMAADVTQAVFVLLARKAAQLRDNTVLTAWLLTTTRLVCRATLRKKIRREQLEQEAAAMPHDREQVDTLSAWKMVEPMLDEALSALSETDRSLVALRFFQSKSHAEIAAALGLTQDASRKRLSRAIEKLRKFFARRAITVTAVTLLAAISQNAVQAAPPGLALKATAAASGPGASAAVTSLVNAALKLLTWMQMKVAALSGAALLVAAVVTFVAVAPSSDVVIGPDSRQARLDRYEFTAAPVRYVYPPSSRFPRTLIESPEFRGEPLLSAQFSWRVGPNYPGVEALRIRTADENDNEFDPVIQRLGGIEPADGNEYWAGDASVFPRRGKNVRLRLLSNGKTLAEFKIPNPAPGPHPTWAASPLPTSATQQGLEVTLARFRAYHTSFGTSAGRYSRTECDFALREKARPTLDWTPGLFEISDATGNHWRGAPDNRVDRVLDGNGVRGGFMGALWPGESAWKLLVEFKRIANFPENELIRLSRIRIPSANDIDPPRTFHDRNETSVQLVAVIGKDVDGERTSWMNTDRMKGCITIVLSGVILAQHKQLRFVNATDDQGRRVALAGHREPGNPESTVPFSLLFEPPAGAQELNLVVAVSESRFFEFLAKPEQVKE